MLTGEQLKAMHGVMRAHLAGEIVLPDDVLVKIENELNLHHADLLQLAVQGEATDEDISHIVRHHWPEVLLDSWQRTLIRKILSGQGTDLNEVAIKGCTKAGKGFAVATAACLWYQATPECKVIITSQRHKHAHDVMYAEVLRCRKRMRHACDGDNGDTRIKTNEQKYIATASPESGEGFCHDDQTEVLSGRGWLPFEDVRECDGLLSMNPRTFECEYIRPTAIFRQHYKGEMCLYTCAGADFCVTPNHQMFVESTRSREEHNDYFELKSITDLKTCYMLRGMNWHGTREESFVIPAMHQELNGNVSSWPERTICMDDWLAFLGWYFSHGHLGFQRGLPSRIHITQSKEQTIDELRLVVDRLGFVFSEKVRDCEGRQQREFTICNRPLAKLVSHYGHPKCNRRVPDYLRMLSRDQIRIFVDTFARGDGFQLKANRRIVYGSYRGLMADVHELALKAGYQSFVEKRGTAGEVNVIDGREVTTNLDKYVLSLSPWDHRIKFKTDKLRRIDYDGMTYCASVPPHGLLYTRRNGKPMWSGNSGQHGPATLFLFDEATSVPEEYWDLSQTQAACSVALANPRTMGGWFRSLFPSHALDATQEMEIAGGRRFLLTVGGNDCLNVKSGKLTIPHQISRERYLAIKAHPNPRWSRVFGDGQFPEEDEDVLVIVPSWLDRHLDAWRQNIHVVAFGLDVAASEHGDRTILAAGGTGGCAAIHELQDVDTMRVVGWVVRTAERHGVDLKSGSVPVTVDMDGLGKGVGDRLAELGCWVIEFRGNATSEEDPKQYANLRAEGYGELGRRLDPRGAWPDEPWALPRDGEMLDDLCAPEKVYSSDGVKFKLTPKDKPTAGYKGETLRQKLGRSPDRGDAVAYLYHAVRMQQTYMDWHQRWDDEGIASGEDPVEESKPLTQEELDDPDLPDYIKELVLGARELAQDRAEWDEEQRMDRDWDDYGYW